MRCHLLSLSLLLFATACSEEQPAKAQGPQLPPLTLAPFMPELEQLANSMPQLDDATRRELDELAEIALHIVAADRRIMARAERSLLEHPDAWFVLEPALQHDEAAVRRRAAWLCGRTGLSILQMPLLQRLKYESDPEAVVWVADALQRLGNDTGLAWLDAAMTAEATAQTAGELAIEICKDRSVELVDSPSYVELRQAMLDLGTRWRSTGVGGKPDVAPPRGEQLDARIARRLATTQSTLLRPIDDAKFVLTRSGTIALPLLERTLAAEEFYLRAVALEILARLGPCARQTSPTVMQLLSDPLTALYAVRALGEIGEQAALPYLRPMLDSIDIELRSAAAQALGLLKDEQSRGALTARLQDDQETMDVRVGAAFALLYLGEHAEAERYLAEREQQGDYHPSTLARLRERLASR